MPYYVLFDRYQNQLRVFQLVGTRYQEMTLQNQRIWFEDLELGLGVWQGTYQDAEGLWLRWFDATGQWVPTAMEQATAATQRAEQEAQRAEQEAQRAEQERQRADRLAAKLKELGIDLE